MNSNQLLKITYGPREKGDATRHFEQLIKDLLHSNPTDVNYNFAGEIIIRVNQHFYNLTQLLYHKPDFEFIQFNETDLEKYGQLIADMKSPQRRNAIFIDNDAALKINSLGINQYEACAIRYYTDSSGFYKLVNHLFRHNAKAPFDTNQYHKLPQKLIKEIADDYGINQNAAEFLDVMIKEILVHSAIAIAALNRNSPKKMRIYFINKETDINLYTDKMKDIGLVCTQIGDHYQIRIFYHGSILKEEAMVNLEQRIHEATRPSSTSVPEDSAYYYFNLNEKMKLINEINEFSKKDFFELDPDDHFYQNLRFFLCHQTEVYQLMYETIVRIETITDQANDPVDNKIDMIKRASQDGAIYRVEGLQSAYGEIKQNEECDEHQTLFSTNKTLVITIKTPLNYVKNIQSISVYPDEKERLLLPGTQILFKNYQKKESCPHELRGEVIRSIDHIDPSSYSRAHLAVREILLFHLSNIISDMIQENIDHNTTLLLSRLLQSLNFCKVNLLTMFNQNSVIKNSLIIEILCDIENMPSELKEKIKRRLPAELNLYFDFQINTGLIFKKILEQYTQIAEEDTPSDHAYNNIKKLVDKSNHDYFDQGLYGGDALNRQFLLDQEVADLLDQETLQCLFYCIKHHDSRITVKRDISPEITHAEIITTTLADILIYGLRDKPSLEFVNPNYTAYGLREYETQQLSYNHNTRKIIANINAIAKKMNSEIIYDDPAILVLPDQNRTIHQKFIDVKNAITSVIKDPKTGINVLLSIATKQTPDDLFSECYIGLKRIGKFLGYQVEQNNNSILFNTSDTLGELIRQFLNHDRIIFDEKVMHYFYDKIHFIACLVNRTNIIIGNQSYQFSDVIDEIMKQCSQLAVDQHARKQFDLRINQIENYFLEKSKLAIHYYPQNSPWQKYELNNIGQCRIDFINTLFLAARNGDINVINSLIATGIDVNKRNAIGQTPLDIAIAIKHTAMVKSLIAAGARCKNVSHLVRAAVSSGITDIVQAVIDADADVNQTDTTETPLFIAAQIGLYDIVKVLIRGHARLDQINITEYNQPWTAIEIAIIYNNKDIVEILICAGVKINEKYVYMALNRKHNELTQFLLNRYRDTDQLIMLIEKNKTYELVPKLIALKKQEYKKFVDILVDGIECIVALEKEKTKKSMLQFTPISQIVLVAKMLEHAKRIQLDNTITITNKFREIIIRLIDCYNSLEELQTPNRSKITGHILDIIRNSDIPLYLREDYFSIATVHERVDRDEDLFKKYAEDFERVSDGNDVQDTRLKL